MDKFNLIGSPGYAAIEKLVSRTPGIARVALTRYVKPRLVQQRVHISRSERKLLASAFVVRKNLGLPFWDSIMTVSMRSGCVPASLLSAAEYHKTNRGHDMVFNRAEVLKGKMGKKCVACGGNSWLAFISEVMLANGSVKHLPILDFHCAKSKHGEKLVIEVVKRLFPKPRVVVESGQSYHAYSGKLLDEDEFIDLLARALLFAPITDRAYISHQILERRASIRISAGGREKEVPFVVWADF
jgi:hypothetical protein